MDLREWGITFSKFQLKCWKLETKIIWNLIIILLAFMLILISIVSLKWLILNVNHRLLPINHLRWCKICVLWIESIWFHAERGEFNLNYYSFELIFIFNINEFDFSIIWYSSVNDLSNIYFFIIHNEIPRNFTSKNSLEFWYNTLLMLEIESVTRI